jgi:putative tryptophan/tyrosine transport system substrate-binding protein
MQATTTIPIISTASEPLESGLVKNLARPEGNVTGIANMAYDLLAKRVELLKQLVPRLSRLAFITRKGVDRVDLERQSSELNHAADVLGFSWQVFSLAGAEDVDKVFADLAAEGFDAAYIAGGVPFKSVNKLVTRRADIECLQSLLRTSMPGPALFSAMART